MEAKTEFKIQTGMFIICILIVTGIAYKEGDKNKSTHYLKKPIIEKCINNQK